MTTTEPTQETDGFTPEEHEARHRLYRRARAYVDASLRDEGRDPKLIRAEVPMSYGAAVSRVFRDLLAKK